MTLTPRSRDLRKGRYSEPGRIYLLTAVTAGRRPWFRDWRLGRIVVQSMMLESTDDVAGNLTLAYVVMPDHFHWLTQLGEGHDMAEIMQRLKSSTAHRVNRELHRHGALWQPGYHDHALRREEDLKAVARYIVANPLRAGLVETLGDYPLWDAAWL